jgi:hypothetical protein
MCICYIELNMPLANPTNWYKMKTITIFISMITILFLADKACSETYLGALIASVKSNCLHFTDIFCEPDDNVICDIDVQPDFFNASSATTDNGYLASGSFYIAEIWKEPRLNVLLDYESRAP